MTGILHIDPKHTHLWDEIRTYRWKEGSQTEPVNSHKYHILDCVMYFFDTLPDEEKMPVKPKTWEEEILEANLLGAPKITPRKQDLRKRPRTLIMSSSLPGCMR
jgi:hypothetical protein